MCHRGIGTNGRFDGTQEITFLLEELSVQILQLIDYSLIHPIRLQTAEGV